MHGERLVAVWPLSFTNTLHVFSRHYVAVRGVRRHHHKHVTVRSTAVPNHSIYLDRQVRQLAQVVVNRVVKLGILFLIHKHESRTTQIKIYMRANVHVCRYSFINFHSYRKK